MKFKINDIVRINSYSKEWIGIITDYEYDFYTNEIIGYEIYDLINHNIFFFYNDKEIKKIL